MGGRRAATGAASLPDLQRRRVGARHLQGSRDHRRRSLRTHRGDDDRRLRDELRARASSTCAASIRRRTRSSGTRSPKPAAAGFWGDDILGQGFSFDIEIRKGAGAYICGEETAIFNSIEGFRGEPRNKPPFPVVAGLFGEADGDQQRRDARQRARLVLGGWPGIRRDRHRGVDRPEAVLPLRPYRAAGRLRGARSATTLARASRAGRRRCRAAGRCRPCCSAARREAFCPDELDLPLTFEDARDAGTTLGSGVVLVFDDTVDLPRIAHADRCLLP